MAWILHGCKIQAIVPVVYAQKDLKVGQGDKGMKGRFLALVFIIHGNRVNRGKGGLYKGFLYF
jgi:hypothetical protein